MTQKIEISVITAVFNGEKFVEESIKSIIGQKNDNIEYIIIDGGSTDNTVEIIKKYADKIDYFISEPDNGIYDAWNKGVKQAKGDWIMFIGCDDFLVDNALQVFSQFIKNADDKTEYISSRRQMIDENNKKIRVIGWEWEWPLFLKFMTVAHTASLHSKKLFEKYGYFDTKYKIVGDYEFLLRPREKLKAQYFDFISVVMREGGTSDTMIAIREQYKAVVTTGGEKKNAALLNFYYICAKHFTKKLLRKVGVNLYLKV
jgi:glycosyltransferase involved in cell wall biosynthesis